MVTLKQQIKEICSFSEEKLAMLAIIEYVNGCDAETDEHEFMSEIEDLKEVDEDEAKRIKYDRIEELVDSCHDPIEVKSEFTRYMRILNGNAKIDNWEDWDDQDDVRYYKNGAITIMDDQDVVTAEWRYYYHDDAGKILFWSKANGWFDGQKYTSNLAELTESFNPE